MEFVTSYTILNHTTWNIIPNNTSNITPNIFFRRTRVKVIRARTSTVRRRRKSIRSTRFDFYPLTSNLRHKVEFSSDRSRQSKMPSQNCDQSKVLLFPSHVCFELRPISMRTTTIVKTMSICSCWSRFEHCNNWHFVVFRQINKR